MALCKLCQSKEVLEAEMCLACLDKIGVIEMPLARRRAAPCVKCNGMKFVRVIPREHTVEAGREMNYEQVAPMTLTQEPKVNPRMLFAGNNVDAPTIIRGKGLLETYTCVGCGYVEWYVEDPTEIPIGPEFMSELIDYESDKPYR